MQHENRLADLQKGLMEILLLRARKQGRIDGAVLETADDVDHPLEGDGERLKIRMGLEGLHRPDLFIRRDQVLSCRWPGRRRRRHRDGPGQMSWFSNRPLKNSSTAAFVSSEGRFNSGPRMARLSSIRASRDKRIAFRQDDVDDAERLAAQGIGIGGSGRNQADAEEPARSCPSCRRC